MGKLVSYSITIYDDNAGLGDDAVGHRVLVYARLTGHGQRAYLRLGGEDDVLLDGGRRGH